LTKPNLIEYNMSTLRIIIIIIINIRDGVVRYLRAVGFILLVAVTGVGCAANEENGESLRTAPTDGPALHTDVPTYTFLSRLNGMSMENGVAIGGQIARHALIDTLETYIAGVTGQIDIGDFSPSEGDLLQELELFFNCAVGMCDSEIVALFVEDDLSQTRRGDISIATRLVDKIAGNDPIGQHRDWESEFRGWSNDSPVTPESLMRMWFSTLDAAAVARANGSILLTPSGEPLNQIYVTAEGLDLNQVIQKFPLGAITFSQATDDYLDDDLDGRGLNTSNVDLLDGPWARPAVLPWMLWRIGRSACSRLHG
jgi:hypothetical protein